MRAIVSAFLVTLVLSITVIAVAVLQVVFGHAEWNTKWNAETASVALLASGGIFIACFVIFLFSGRK